MRSCFFLLLSPLAFSQPFHSSWFSRYGVPRASVPAAVCDKDGLTIIVPGTIAPLRNEASWGSPLLLSVDRIILPPSYNRKSPCRARHVGSGLLPMISAKSVWIAHASHRHCRAHYTKISDSIDIRVNKFTYQSATSTAVSVIATCTCFKDNGRPCSAGAYWEREVLSWKRGFWSGGYSTTLEAVVGENHDIAISKAAAFESYGNPETYLWPWNCKLKSSSTTIDVIIGGCQIHPSLKFQIQTSSILNPSFLSTNQKASLRKGYAAFSMEGLPSILKDEEENGTKLSLKCAMIELIEEPPIDPDYFCRKSVVDLKNSTEAPPIPKSFLEREFSAADLFKTWMTRTSSSSPKRQLLPMKKSPREIAQAKLEKKFAEIKDKFDLSLGIEQLPESLNEEKLMESWFNRQQPLDVENSPSEFFVRDPSSELKAEGPVFIPPVLEEDVLLSRQQEFRRPERDQVFNSIKNEISYGDWNVAWGRSPLERQTNVRVGNKDVSWGSGIGLQHRAMSTSFVFKDFNMNLFGQLDTQEAAVGAKFRDYGVAIVRNQQENSVVTELITPYVELGTLANFLDRNYGQKLRIKDFQIVARHDFNENEFPDPSKFATEFLVGYKRTGVGVSTDVADSKYGVSVGVGDYKISVLRDFDEKETDMVANWAGGWQLYLSGDAPDQFSESMMARVGFGHLKKAYVVAAAGIGDDGIPEFNAHYQGKEAAFLMDFEGGLNSDKTLLTGLSLGKFTYLWESTIALDNLPIPMPFGIEPYAIRNFLTPGGGLRRKQQHS